MSETDYETDFSYDEELLAAALSAPSLRQLAAESNVAARDESYGLEQASLSQTTECMCTILILRGCF